MMLHLGEDGAISFGGLVAVLLGAAVLAVVSWATGARNA